MMMYLNANNHNCLSSLVAILQFYEYVDVCVCLRIEYIFAVIGRCICLFRQK